MRDHRLFLARLGFASALLLGIVPLACGSSGGNDGASPGNGDDAGVDGASSGSSSGSTGDGGACTANLAACTQNADCCSHLCLGNQCSPSLGTCGQAGQACGVNTDCCGGACVNGTCSSAACVSIGGACPAGGGACCTATCVGGSCAAIGGSGGADGGTAACVTANNTCAKDADCCSGLCSNGRCNIASSFCVQNGDMCFDGASCCGGVCTAPDGQPVTATNPGLCSLPPGTGGTNCTGVDGTICNPTKDPSLIGCADGCCSHLCAPFGPTGVLICQQAQGCRVEGDLCKKDGDCCGGEPSSTGLLGAGLVTCAIAAGQTIGVCTTPTASGGGGNACVPAGDVCHYTSDPSYTCPSSAARADCCDGQTPNKALCRLDKLGVPRCLAYGGGDAGANACRTTGQSCTTASDCCDGSPCVPGAGGALTCSGAACVPSSGACTSNADCCAGVQCVIPVGSLAGSCAPSTTTGGDAGSSSGGSDGGSSSGGGSCALLGQSCASAACCTGTQCYGGTCIVVR